MRVGLREILAGKNVRRGLTRLWLAVSVPWFGVATIYTLDAVARRSRLQSRLDYLCSNANLPEGTPPPPAGVLHG
jgi:hypothetical protein